MFRIFSWLVFGFLLIAAHSHAAQDEWTGVERIIAVGDVHGDHEQFLTVLRSAGLIDDRENWSGGRAHLVQLGDVLDRGPDSRKSMDLLMNLEKQAQSAGGRVHALIGNHEAMNVYGDLRYVSKGEFEAFRMDGSEKRPPMPGQPPGFAEHRAAFAPGGRYGRWILRHNAIVKINDILFVHGGIGPKYAHLSLDDINELVRHELRNGAPQQGGIITDNEGPLWYRGLATRSDPALADDVARILRKHKARKVIVGHTVSPAGVTTRVEGSIVLADVGLSKVYGRSFGYVAIENSILYAVSKSGPAPIESRREVAVGSRPALIP